MEPENEDDELLLALRLLQEKAAQLESTYSIMNPEERAAVELLQAEHESEQEFLEELKLRFEQGSISTEQVLRWTAECVRQMTERYKRLLKKIQQHNGGEAGPVNST